MPGVSATAHKDRAGPMPGPGRAPYDAFISYSQRGDRTVARALRAAIQTIGKPWWRLRELNVFVDATSLSAAPGLWASISSRLDGSRFLILLASPEAARSPWVDREVAHFLGTDGAGVERLLIGLTEGTLVWQADAGDFEWHPETPLPPSLRGRFREEPLWVDLRRFRGEPALATRGNRAFLDAALDLTATIKGVEKADLYSDEIRQQRRSLRLAYGGAAAVAMLAAGVGIAAVVAVERAEEAARNFAIASGTVAGIVTDVTGELAHVDGMRTENLRKILSRVEAAIDSLLATAPDDPEVLANHAEMLDQIATVYDEKGDPRSALDALAGRREALLRLATLDPARASGAALARTLASIGHEQLALGGVVEAERAATESVGDLRQLIADAGSPDAALRSALAWSLLKLGNVRAEQGRGPEAIAALDESVGIYRALVAEEPAEPDWPYQLGWALNSLARERQAAGESAAALALFGEIVAIRRAQSDAKPDDLRAKADVAWALVEAAGARSATGDTGGAHDDLVEARRVYAAVTGSDPQNAVGLNGLLVASVALGDREAAAGRPGSALALYREAVGLGRQLSTLYPDAILWQQNLSSALAATGRLTASVEDDRDAAVSLVTESVDIARRMLANAPQADGGRMALAARLVALGDLYRSIDLPGEAAAPYAEAMAIRTALSAEAPDEPERTDSLSIVVERAGATALANGDAAVALDHFKRALAMRQGLVARDPDSAAFRSGVAWAEEWIGDTERRLGRRGAAVTAYRDARDGFRQIGAGREPDLVAARRACTIEGKIGGVLGEDGDRAGGREAYARGLACLDDLGLDGGEDHPYLAGVVVDMARMMLRERDLTDAADDRRALAEEALGRLSDLRDTDADLMTGDAWRLLDEAEQAVEPETGAVAEDR